MLSVFLAGLLQAAPAPAPETQPSVITKPDWLSLPTGADIAKAYPSRAARQGGGRATIECSVEVSGRLTGCQIIAEDPLGVGFGDAALAMSAKFRMKPMTRDGKPAAGGIVRIPIRFGLAATEAPLPPLPPGGLRFGEVYWLRTPDSILLRAAYPARAAKRNLVGRVVLHCTAGVTGQLLGCKPAVEEPTGEGFAAAILSLSHWFSMRMTTVDGRPIKPGTPIQVPIRFRQFPITLDAVQASHPKLGEGRVVLDCRVTEEGRLDNCIVDRETPRDSGLGDVAVRLSSRMRFASRPDELDRVLLPIDFTKTPSGEKVSP